MSLQKGISRRNFIIGAAGACAALGGAGALFLRQPSIEFTEPSFEHRATPLSVLVAYTSQYGSTGGVAAAIGRTLNDTGAAVDVRLIKNIKDISAYNAVIVGSPVHSNKWLPEATSFVEANRTQLSKIPVAYFLTCMALGLSNQPETIQKIAGALEMVQRQVPEVNPIDKALFAGALDYNKLSFLMQVMYRIFAEDSTSGDYRNWDAIHAWSETIGRKLAATLPKPEKSGG